MSIEFFVPGHPKSTQTGSVITVKGRTFPLRRNTAWATLFGWVARQHAPDHPLDGALEASFTFYLRPPIKKRQYPTVRPDWDNLCKGLADQMVGVQYHDDAQLVAVHVYKVYGLCGEVGVKVYVGPHPTPLDLVTPIPDW
jgi:Holliday junction resolvase RusA-like endonuclease